MTTVASKSAEDASMEKRNIHIAKESSPAVKLRPISRAQTLGDITARSSSPRRRSSLWTTDSQTEKISMKSSVDDLLLPTSSTKNTGHGSSHFHSTPLLFAVLPALGGILFDGGSVILTDICIIGLACIFLNWSLRLPWDWYHSAQAIVTEYVPEDEQDDTILEETEDESSDQQAEMQPRKSKNSQDTIQHLNTIHELNQYQLVALVCCFAGPLLGAWLLHSIREQLSRPSEGIISNFNLGIFVLAAELRPTQHVFKLVQSRILYLQRTAAKNPYATSDVDSIALEDLKTRLNDLEAHIVNRVEQVSPLEQQTTVMELRKAIQPELDALNRAVRRYEKRAIALEMQVRAELQDHDQRIKDALALAAAVTRHKKGSFMTALDFVAAVVMFPIQAVFATISAIIDVPKNLALSLYESMDRLLNGKPAWLFPKKASSKKRDRDGSIRRKRKE